MARLATSDFVKLVIVLIVAGVVTGRSCRGSTALRRQIHDQNNAGRAAGSVTADLASKFPVIGFDEAFRSDSSEHGTEESIARIEQLIGSGHRVDLSSGLSAACETKLRRRAAEFVYHRFINTDPERYVDWRMRQGDAFRERDELYGRLLIGADHEELFGVPLAEDAPLREVFARFAVHLREAWGETHTPVGIAHDPEAAFLMIRQINPVVGPEKASLGAAERDTFWLAPELGTHRNWFARQGEDDGFRQYVSGVVGITLAYGNGEKRTMQIGFRSWSGTCDWRLDWVATMLLHRDGGLIDY